MNINGQSQNSNFDIIVSHKSDAYPIYFKEVKRFNQQYINPTGYLISVRAKDTKAIQDLKEKIASWVKLNKPVQSLEQRLAYLEDKEGIKSTSYKFEAVNYKFSNTSNSECKVPKKGKIKIIGVVKYKNGVSKSLNTVITNHDYLIVAMGDSYISGGGNPDKNLANQLIDVKCDHTTTALIIDSYGKKLPSNNKDQWQESNAHRSLNNGANLASKMYSGKDGNTYNLIRFVSFTRSGAKIIDGLVNYNHDKGRDDYIKLGQVDEAYNNIENSKIDVLILSIGGNDVNFADGLKYLLTDWSDNDYSEKKLENATERKRLENEFKKDLALLDQKYKSLNSKLKKLNYNKILITEYPVGLFETTKNGKVIDGDACGVFKSFVSGFTFEKEDGVLFKKLGKDLNSKIKEVAIKFGWIYVDGIDQSFSGHGYCAPNTFFVGAEESCRKQDDFNGMAHPNIYGHKEIAKNVFKKMKPILDKIKTSLNNGFTPNGTN